MKCEDFPFLCEVRAAATTYLPSMEGGLELFDDISREFWDRTLHEPGDAGLAVIRHLMRHPCHPGKQWGTSYTLFTPKGRDYLHFITSYAMLFRYWHRQSVVIIARTPESTRRMKVEIEKHFADMGGVVNRFIWVKHRDSKDQNVLVECVYPRLNIIEEGPTPYTPLEEADFFSTKPDVHVLRVAEWKPEEEVGPSFAGSWCLTPQPVGAGHFLHFPADSSTPPPVHPEHPWCTAIVGRECAICYHL